MCVDGNQGECGFFVVGCVAITRVWFVYLKCSYKLQKCTYFNIYSLNIRTAQHSDVEHNH